MPKYIVKPGRHVTHDKAYPEGAELELDVESAAPLIACGAIEEAPAKAAKKAKAEDQE